MRGYQRRHRDQQRPSVLRWPFKHLRSIVPLAICVTSVSARFGYMRSSARLVGLRTAGHGQRPRHGSGWEQVRNTEAVGVMSAAIPDLSLTCSANWWCSSRAFLADDVSDVEQQIPSVRRAPEANGQIGPATEAFGGRSTGQESGRIVSRFRSTFAPADALMRGTGRDGSGRGVTAGAVGGPFVLVTGDRWGRMGTGRDPCKIAGLRLPRFESWFCHTTSDLRKHSGVSYLPVIFYQLSIGFYHFLSPVPACLAAGP